MFNFRSSGKFNGKVKTDFRGQVEPQEIFLDKLSRKREEEDGISERKLEVLLPGWVAKIFGLFVCLLLFLLLGRSFQMQIIDGESYSSLAQRNRMVIQPARILRGVIYDKKGSQLVQNSASFDIRINKSRIETEKDYVLNQLSVILEKEIDYLKERISEIENNNEILVKNIDHEAAITIKIKEDDLPGVHVERNMDRDYSEGEYLAHILGYTGEVTREEMNKNPDKYVLHDHIGKAGIEKYYEDNLAKERGSFKIETDARGNLMSREEIDPVKPGNNLELWIDFELQKKATEALEEVLEEIGSKKGAIVAMNPNTGGILSMVSIPSYDNNVFSRTGDKDLLNEFLIDQDGVFLNRTMAGYPAGSTTKPLLAAAALEEGIISPEKKIHSPGYLDIPNPWDPTNPTRMRDYQAHGWTNIKEAIAVSSNVYFYTIGGGHKDQEGLGIARMKKYLELFGWGKYTNIDLPNEKAGLIPDPEWKTDNIGASWTLGDTYNTSIGQGYLSISPLQLSVSYSALVNGGKVLEPRIVKSIHENDKKIKEIESKVAEEGFISSDNLEIVKEGMKMAVEEGTARRLSWLPVDAGAKTGTAQIPKEGYYHNWISVFAPYEDPEIVLTVLIEEVEGITASTSMVSYEVLNWYFNENKK